AEQRLFAVAMQDEDTNLVIGLGLDENGEIRFAITIEVAPLKERVDPTRCLDPKLRGRGRPTLGCPRRQLFLQIRLRQDNRGEEEEERNELFHPVRGPLT